MKKLLIVTALATAAFASASQAQVNLDVNFGGPAYVEPAPVYVAPRPYYAPRHDVGYWNGRERHHARAYDWDRDHRDGDYDHHDNGRHEGWDHH